MAALGGCSVAGGEETRTVTVEQPSSGAGTTEAEAPAPGPVLAEAPVTVDEVPGRFVISELRRSGATVILNARLEPTAEADTGGQIGQVFSDNRLPGEGGEDPQALDNFDGVSLIDGEGRKKYLVARDPEGLCVCTSGLNGSFLRSGPVNLEATLTAPPPSVRRVDVVVPQVKTFAGVPISG